MPTMNISYVPDQQKIIETALWFLNRSKRTDLHSILKELFYSDKFHINKYGRPVSGDYYVKMDYGPVGSYAYDLLKHNRISEYVKRQRFTPDILENAIRSFNCSDPLKIQPLRTEDFDYFSKTDIECMEMALSKCDGCGFDELIKITHCEPAWQKADMNGDMNFEDFIDQDTPNREELLEYIKESSECLAL